MTSCWSVATMSPRPTLVKTSRTGAAMSWSMAVHADPRTVGPDGLGDAAGDGAGAASDVEHREAGTQQRRRAAVPRPERAGVENRAGALRHMGPLAGDVRPIASGCPTASVRAIGFSYPEPAGGVACRR